MPSVMMENGKYASNGKVNNQVAQRNDKETQKQGNPCPYLSAFLLSKLTFWWLGDLFRLGAKKPLEPSDIYDALPSDRADYCINTYDRISSDLSRKKPEKQPTIWQVFVRQFKKHIIVTAILVIIWESIKIVQPVLVGWLVIYFQHQDEAFRNSSQANETTPLSTNEAYICGALLALSSYINAWPPAFYFAIQQNVAMRMRSICCTLIFRKSLRLSNKALANVSSGRIVNLMSTDVEKFHNGLLFLHFLWVAPVEIVVIMLLMYFEVGFSFIPGLAFMLLLLPLQLRLGKTFGRLRLSTAAWTDQRILVMGEVLAGMRVIKMYCWEKPFGKLVDTLRKSEMGVIAKALNIKGLNTAIAILSPKIVTCLIVLMYYLTGHEMTAAKVVKVISWSELLRMGVFTFLSNAAQFGTEMFTSVKRIQEFMYEEELSDQQTARSVARPVDPEWNRDISVALYGVESKWESPDPRKEETEQETSGFTLNNISMEVEEGKLVALAGPVGSGKSSLLLTLLGEMPISQGSSSFNGEIAYVPQEAWVFAGTIRDNVLFGQAYSDFKYKRTLKACALDRDLELMEFGDQTLVGEKGFSLSGGQRARINLARAVYRDADIYLMDDPLSAVDSKVGRHIFQKCICGELKYKTRILVTHQVQFLKDVDYVYIMSEGSIVAEGTHKTVSHDVNLMRSLSVASDTASRRGSTLRRGSSTRRSMQSINSINDVGEEIQVLDEVGTPHEEEMVKGSVSLGVFARYFAAGHGMLVFPLFLLLAISTQAIYNFTDWFLTSWNEHSMEEDKRMIIYGALVAIMVLIGCTRSIVYMVMSCSASNNLHQRMFAAVLRAPMAFFDKNPTGRTLNRFSRDTGFMDDILVQTFHQVWIFILVFLGIIGFVTYTIYYSLLVTIPVICIICYLRYYTMKTMRSVKRIEALVRSPVYSHLSATLLGLPVVRAFDMEKPFIQTFFQHQDQHNSAWFLFLSASRWFGMRLDWLIATYFTGCIAASFIITNLGSDILDGGQIGLSLSYISAMLGMFQFIMRQTTEVESYMTSVERIQQYTTIEPEAEEYTEIRPAVTWPQQGSIHFDHMSLAYNPDAKNVLDDITLDIRPKEKIGIVGRTGAGKSSLISCLFRLAEPTGRIWVDGHDITTLGLTDVRKKISIIPQDPVLFSGSLRYNLDPLSEYEDEDLWKSLHAVHLHDKVKQMPGRLSAEMAESGSNFSVGQRQLVCLARAILKSNRILVIDEATANVDQSTDKLIQKTIRTKFKDCTVLCIAHRLNTIIDSDRVLVLDHGAVMQFAHPHILLQDGNGIFYEMVKQTGSGASHALTRMAQMAYEGQTYEEDEGEEEEEDLRDRVIGRGGSQGLRIDTPQVQPGRTNTDGRQGYENRAFENTTDEEYDTYL